MIVLKKYEQVKIGIMEFIETGKYLPNQRISSESELTHKFGVSRHTVRKAINDLVNEGFLYTEQGSGTFCADRNIKQPPEKTIALLTTYISNYIFPSIINGVESYLSSKGYTLLLYSTNNDVKKEKTCLENILNRNVAGVIVEPTKSNFYNPNLPFYLNFERNNIPYLMINAYYPELEPYRLTVDDEAGAYIATEHLIKLGHTHIAGVFKADDQQGVRRMQGFIRAHRKYNIPILSNMIISYTTLEKNNMLNEEFRRLIDSDQRPTGIYFYNDEIAVDALNILREFEINVPDDISIVGFDDSSLATASEVKLTTVSHPKFEMGRQAAETIIRLIEHKGEGNPSIMYKPKLILRQSTKKL